MRLVAELGLALAGDRAVVDRQLRGLRDDRRRSRSATAAQRHAPSPSADCCPKSTRSALLALERARERARRGDEIGAGECVVGHEHRAVGAHRERLAQRVGRALGAERDDDDLALAGGVAHAQRLLDRMRVEVREREVAAPVEPLVAGSMRRAGGRVGHRLDADRDLHRRDGELRREEVDDAPVGAPGVNTSATPSRLSSAMSSSGIVPPTKTSTSSAPRSREQVDDARDERHVRAGEDRDADRVGVLLDRGLDDLLGRLVEAGVDDLHAGVAQRAGDDLGATVVPVEARLGDDDADGAHRLETEHRFGTRTVEPGAVSLRP